MSKFEDFHAVLHSMQEREKQYLLQHLESGRLRRQQGGSETVVPLVNLLIKYALEQRDGADEEALIARLNREGRYKSYANTLFHAYRKVLRLLHRSHDEDPRAEMSHLLFVASWMRSRRHLDQLEDVLSHAEKIASVFEFFQAEVEVLEHRKFLFAIQPKKYKLDQLQDRIRDLREKSAQADDLLLLADELQLRRQVVSGLAALGDFESPLIRNLKDCKSVRAKIHFHRSWISLHLAATKYDKALSSIKSLIQVMQSNSLLLKEPTLAALYYQYAFSGLQTCIALGKASEGKDFSSILEDGELKASDPAKYFEYSTRAWLWSVDITRTAEEVSAQRMNEIQRQLDKYATVLGDGPDLMISHQVAVIHMLSGQPRKAVVWINRNMRTQPGLHRPDLVAFAYIFFVIAKFEMGEWDMVERGKRSAITFLQKSGLTTPIYDELLKGLVRASRVEGTHAYTVQLKRLKDSLVSLLQVKGNEQANFYFDIPQWLERVMGK